MVCGAGLLGITSVYFICGGSLTWLNNACNLNLRVPSCILLTLADRQIHGLDRMSPAWRSQEEQFIWLQIEELLTSNPV